MQLIEFDSHAHLVSKAGSVIGTEPALLTDARENQIRLIAQPYLHLFLLPQKKYYNYRAL